MSRGIFPCSYFIIYFVFMFTCVSLWVHMHMCAGTKESRKGWQVPWSWDFRWVWAAWIAYSEPNLYFLESVSCTHADNWTYLPSLYLWFLVTCSWLLMKSTCLTPVGCLYFFMKCLLESLASWWQEHLSFALHDHVLCIFFVWLWMESTLSKPVVFPLCF